MYVPYEKLGPEVKRLVSLDLVSKGEVEDAVSRYITVRARVEAVSIILANLEDEFRGVSQYAWYFHDFSITNPEPRIARDPNMAHLRNSAVSVTLYANRNGTAEEEIWLDSMATMHRGGSIDDGRDIISRRISFPVRYLTSDDWLDEAKRNAMQRELFWLKRNVAEMPAGLESRRRGIVELEERLAKDSARIAEIEALGITS